MNCPRCGAGLGHVTEAGRPMMRTRGLVVTGPASAEAICPKCKGPVPVSADLAKALVLFFRGPPGPAAQPCRRPRRPSS